MRRGIIRIVSGVVLLVLQLIAMIGTSSTSTNETYDMWVNIGFYIPAIIGIILLFVGIRVCSNGVYSKLVLHNNNKKFHTIVKWCGFAISTILFIYYVLNVIFSLPNFDVFNILYILGFLSFSIYSLFYMFKKPSCLFSTALILFGVAYIYGSFVTYSYAVSYWLYSEYFIPYILFFNTPRFVIGVLCITVAFIIYREKFSVNTVRIIGWTILVLEILSRVGYRLAWKNILIPSLLEIGFILFIIVLMLYMSVVKMNTLRGAPVIAEDLVVGGSSNDLHQTSDQILFCRKCGEKLLGSSQFCRKCGTAVVTVVESKIALQQEEIEPNEHTEQSLVCPGCGEDLEFMGWNEEELKGAQICPFCGKEI